MSGLAFLIHQDAATLVATAVIDSHNYTKQPCLCLCNYYENVWAVSERTLQNGSARSLTAVDRCVSHRLGLGRKLRFYGIWMAWRWILSNTRFSLRCGSASY